MFFLNYTTYYTIKAYEIDFSDEFVILIKLFFKFFNASDFARYIDTVLNCQKIISL